MFMLLIVKLSQLLQKTFALWVLGFAALALYQPNLFSMFLPYIPLVLGIIMFGMGMTLSLDDFKQVLRYPKAVAIGVVAHYLIMPLVAYLLCKLFALPQQIAIGVILVGCCPSGTASNVMTYIAKGNTPLSVACSCVSTCLAPIFTPLMFYLLASEWISIHAGAMIFSILQVVMIPIALGLLVRGLFKSKIDYCLQIMPLISVLAIVIIVAAIVSGSKTQILSSGALILGIVILHNGFGFLFGYWAGKLFNLGYADNKAIALEVGMQNSGLGVALAAVHFAASPLTALPSAVFSLWHNISGPLLASYWATKPDRPSDQE
jgi:BASS family bile acid:Na+ symporter